MSKKPTPYPAAPLDPELVTAYATMTGQVIIWGTHDRDLAARYVGQTLEHRDGRRVTLTQEMLDAAAEQYGAALDFVSRFERRNYLYNEGSDTTDRRRKVDVPMLTTPADDRSRLDISFGDLYPGDIVRLHREGYSDQVATVHCIDYDSVIGYTICDDEDDYPEEYDWHADLLHRPTVAPESDFATWVDVSGVRRFAHKDGDVWVSDSVRLTPEQLVALADGAHIVGLKPVKKTASSRRRRRY